MTNTAGLDLVEDGDGFILSVVDAAGKKTEVRLTDDQVLTLAQSAPLLRGRILSKRSRAAAGVEAVYATQVAQIELSENLLTEEIHLTLIDQHGGRLTHSLTLQIAELLSERLPVRIADLKNKKQAMH